MGKIILDELRRFAIRLVAALAFGAIGFVAIQFAAQSMGQRMSETFKAQAIKVDVKTAKKHAPTVTH